MAKLSVGGSPKIADGLYNATLLHVVERPATPRSPNGDPWLLWTYLIHDRSPEGIQLTALSSTSPGQRAKWRQWAQSILRRELSSGETIDTDDLSMKDCRVVVQFNKETGYTDITQVLPAQDGSQPHQPPPAPPGWSRPADVRRDDPDDIPF